MRAKTRGLWAKTGPVWGNDHAFLAAIGSPHRYAPTAALALQHGGDVRRGGDPEPIWDVTSDQPRSGRRRPGMVPRLGDCPPGQFGTHYMEHGEIYRRCCDARGTNCSETLLSCPRGKKMVDGVCVETRTFRPAQAGRRGNPPDDTHPDCIPHFRPCPSHMTSCIYQAWGGHHIGCRPARITSKPKPGKRRPTRGRGLRAIFSGKARRR